MPRGIQKTAYEAAEILGVSLAEILEADGKATASHHKVSMTRVKKNLKKISDIERLKIQLGADFFQGEPTPASEDWHSQKAEAEPEPEPEPEPESEPKPVPKPKTKPKPKLESKPEVKPEPEPKLEIEPELKPEPKARPKPKAKPRAKPKPEPEPIDGLLERMARLGF